MSSNGLDIERAVHALLGREGASVESVRREPTDYDAFLAGRTLARLEGTARIGARVVGWSFIEKRTEGPATASAYLYDNGLRELRAYQSGLLTDLAPGIRAPALLAAETDAAGDLTLWLEDLGPIARPVRDEDELLGAARDLGRLSGRWLGNVPDAPWLFHGWIDRHRQPEAMPDGLAVVEAARGDPVVEARLGGRLDEAVALIREQDAFVSALRGLPSTLCHHDAVAANVFVPDAGGETILIDWESVGPGAVGADLASLVFASPRRGDVSAELARRLMPDALAAYLDGLADVGARVDPDAVRLGLHASIALRWALVRDVVSIIRGGGRAVRGSALHESPEESLGELIALLSVLLDSAAEARRLMRR